MTNYYDTSYPPSIWATPEPPPEPEPEEPETPEPEPEPDPELLIDPAFFTVDEIRSFITDTYPDLAGLDDDELAGLQAVLDAERAGRNRVTLGAWLEEIDGLE